MMRDKSGVFAVLAGVLTVLLVTGCGSKPKEDQLSVIDENHFDQLASTTDAPGNASSSIEMLTADTTAAQGSLAQQAGMAADGIPVDIATTAQVQTAAAIQAPAIPAQTVTLKPTATYEEKVQAGLKNAGYYTGSVDGKIGSKTREAIKAFQTANGLKADGVVGPGTWEKLKKYLS